MERLNIDSILDDIVELLLLFFLEVIMVLWLSGRLFLFLGDKCWGFNRQSGLILRTNVKWYRKNIHTERKKNIWRNVKIVKSHWRVYRWHYVILLTFLYGINVLNLPFCSIPNLCMHFVHVPVLQIPKHLWSSHFFSLTKLTKNVLPHFFRFIFFSF